MLSCRASCSDEPCCEVDGVFPFPGVMLVLMELLNVLAVFWTAEIIDERKLGVVLLDVAGRKSSTGGVSGAEVILESLLGRRDSEPALPRRCDFMPPGEDALLFGLLEIRDRLASVGVGGVFTMTGAVSLLLGVVGRTFVVPSFCGRETSPSRCCFVDE